MKIATHNVCCDRGFVCASSRTCADVQGPGAALARDGGVAGFAVVHPLQLARVAAAQAPAVAGLQGLLDARRSELRNSRQALLIKAQQYQATVALVRALGGGWEVSAS